MTNTIYTNSGEALNKVNEKAAEMAALENQSEKGYAHLGWLLLEVSQMQFWRIRYETFGQYLASVSDISKKSVAQLQHYFRTVRDLSDTFTPSQLEVMGISKAMRLRAAKDYAIVLPLTVRAAALDPQVTVKDLRKIISTALHLPAEDDGDWYEMDGFMVTPEQRALLDQAIDVAKRTEPLTKMTISESAQMLDVMVKFCQEFLGSHCGDGQ